METGNIHDRVTVETLPLEEEEGGNLLFSEATDDNLIGKMLVRKLPWE